MPDTPLTDRELAQLIFVAHKTDNPQLRELAMALLRRALPTTAIPAYPFKTLETSPNFFSSRND